jgi:hypothetical protein
LIVMPYVIETIDASLVDTSVLGLYRSYFADSGTILSDLYGLMRDDPPERRFGLREQNGPAGKYWGFVACALGGRVLVPLRKLAESRNGPE